MIIPRKNVRRIEDSDDEMTMFMMSDEGVRYSRLYAEGDKKGVTIEGWSEKMSEVFKVGKKQKPNVEAKHSDDPAGFSAAKKKEIDSWLKYDAFEMVQERRVKNDNVIGLRWVLTHKKYVDEKGRNATKCKARLVALGYQDSQAEKNLFAATTSASGHRIFLAVTAAFQWKIGTIDVSTAFLQGKELDRDVYAWPVPEMQVKPGCVIRLRKAVYGLAVAPLRSLVAAGVD